MRLFGRFRSLHIHTYIHTYMGHSVPQLTSLSSQPEDFLAIHDESKDNDDTRSFQQFISEPTTITGRIEAPIRLWWLDVGSEANPPPPTPPKKMQLGQIGWCIIAPNKLKTTSYPSRVSQTILSSSYTLLKAWSSLLVPAPSPASTLTQSMLPVLALGV